jgi:CheY-like chemotaxis protein
LIIFLEGLYLKILIAEDDAISRRILEAMLTKWEYDFISTCDGLEAWTGLQGEDTPELAILDLMMPNMDGIELCRKIRSSPRLDSIYIIILTARGQKEDILAGFQAGADDYITKPFNRDELHARLKVGIRIIELQTKLAQRVKELEDALSDVRQLQGLLPICSYCKRIRDDENYWSQVEEYITERSEARFTHGICPDCYETVVKADLARMKEQMGPNGDE